MREVASDDFLPLGTLESAAVRAAFPDAEWNKPTYAFYDLDNYTAMMIELDRVESSNGIHVTVSGPGNPVPSLLSLANANGWPVVDCSSGEFIDPRSRESKGFLGYKLLWEDLQQTVKDNQRVEPWNASPKGSPSGRDDGQENA